MVAATDFGSCLSSHSHTVITVHPAASSCAVFLASRSSLAMNLTPQYSGCAFGSVGHAGVANYGANPPAGAATPTDRIAYKRGGMDLVVEQGPVTARAVMLTAYDHDTAVNDAAGNGFFPNGNVKETNRAAYVEAQYSWLRGDSKVPFLIPLVRQNWYTAMNGKRQFGYFTAQVAHYFAANVKGFIESSWDTKQDLVGAYVVGANQVRAPKGSRLTAQIEVGF